jgi:heterodisulfide reductase subunit C
VFTSLGDPANRGLHVVIWIAHGLAAFGFIASIPYTKMFHLFTAPMNIFFSSLKPAGELAPARTASGPGVKTWKDFTWKQILDFHACVRCGRCQDSCPAYTSGLKLSPRDLMVKLRAEVWERGNGRPMVGDVIGTDELWACTTCRACVQVCPVFTDQLSSIVDMRRHLVIEGRMDGRLQDALANLGRYGNSFGQSERARAKWTQGLPTPIKDARKEPVEYLWFVGDYGSYNSGLTEITRLTAEVFGAAGLDFGILFEAERNAGNDARRVGEEGLFEMLREKNLASLEKCSFRTIVTTDPHSYNTLKNDTWGRRTAADLACYRAHRPAQPPGGSAPEARLQGHLPTRAIWDGTTACDPRRIWHDRMRSARDAAKSRRALCCAQGGRIWMEEGQMRSAARPGSGKRFPSTGRRSSRSPARRM